jgi:hypothetical protein
MRATAERAGYWQQMVRGYQSSGLSRREYCKQNEIQMHCLDYWQRKFKKQTAGLAEKKQTGWIPLQVSEEEKQGSAGGIRLRIGRVVFEVELGFDPQLLAEALRVVRSTC